MKRMACRALILVWLLAIRAAYCQPPIISTPQDIVDRVIECMRNQQLGELAQLVDTEQGFGFPGDIPLDQLAWLTQLGLLLAGGPESKVIVGAAKLEGDRAVVPVHQDLDLQTELVLVRRGRDWKLDLVNSGPIGPALANQPPAEVVRNLMALVSRRQLSFTLPFWTEETRKVLDLDALKQKPEESAPILRLFYTLWGTRDMKVEVGKPVLQGERATVPVRKFISVDQKVVVVKENGVWHVDLMATAALSLGKEGRLASPYRDRAQLEACANNVKQIVLALLMCAQDRKENLPPADTWVNDLMPYLKNNQVFKCPGAPDAKCGYAFREGLSKVKLQDVEDPATTVVLFESSAGGESPHDAGQSLPAEGRHAGGVALGYLDGHVRWHTAAEARELLAKPLRLKGPPTPGQADLQANAFANYVAAADLLKANGGTGAALQEAGGAEERLAVLERNRGAQQLLREGFKKPYTPRPIEGPDQLFPELAGFRELARLLAVESRVLGDSNQWGRAAQAALDGYRLAHDIPRGGGLLHRLVAIAVESICLQALESAVSHLTADEAKAAITRLAELDRTEVSLAETMEGERTFGRRALEKLIAKPEAAKEWGQEFKGVALNLAANVPALENYYAQLITEARKPLYKRTPIEMPKDRLVALLVPSLDRGIYKQDEAQAWRRLALTALALQAHKTEKGNYPEKIDALTPGYLGDVPADPCHDGPLFYRRTDKGFLLYSAGSDGKDDGGTPLPRAHDMNAKGDLVWGAEQVQPE